MSEYTIALKLPNYLKEWFVHTHGGEEPVHLIKDSAESNIVQMFLRKQPETSESRPGCNVSIYIPTFKAIDVRTYNYMTPTAVRVLESCIYNTFKVQMWKELHTLDRSGAELRFCILAFMEKHGISGVIGDENWNSIYKTYYRTRKKYEKDRSEEGKKN